MKCFFMVEIIFNSVNAKLVAIFALPLRGVDYKECHMKPHTLTILKKLFSHQLKLIPFLKSSS